MPDTLLSTKLYIPPPLINQVSRQRLFNRLDEGIRQGKRLTLISAPAGGIERLFHQPGTHRRFLMGRLYLRSQPHLPLYQRSSDHVDRFHNQPVLVEWR